MRIHFRGQRLLVFGEASKQVLVNVLESLVSDFNVVKQVRNKVTVNTRLAET